MVGVATADVARERVGGGDRGVEIAALAGQLEELDVAEAQLPDLVRLDAAEE